MGQLPQFYVEQLKQTCKLTNARWAGWVLRDSSDWKFDLQYGLNKTRLNRLAQFLTLNQNSTWLAGALSSGRTRWKNLGEFADELGCERLFSFVNPDEKCAILVGAGQLSTEDQGFFRILALNRPQETTGATKNHKDDLVFEIPSGRLLNPNEMFQMSLRGLIDATQKDAAYLALRWGDILCVHGEIGFEQTILGEEILIQDCSIIGEIMLQKHSIFRNGPMKPSTCLFQAYLPHEIASWMGLPVVVGQQAIGVVFLISYQPDSFTSSDQQRAEQYLFRSGHAIDYAAAIGEIMRHLERAVILNELSLTEAGESLSRYASLVVQKLRDAFNADVCDLYLKFPEDGKCIRYQSPYGIGEANIVLQGLLLSLFQQEKIFRLGYDDPLFNGLDMGPEIKSALCAPLTVQTDHCGFLVLGSKTKNDFSSRDEQFLETITRTLAKTIQLLFVLEGKNIRARVLSLIPEIIREIGQLADRKQILSKAAKLLEENFGFDAVWIQYTGYFRPPSFNKVDRLIEKFVFTEDYEELAFCHASESVLRTGKSLFIQNLADYETDITKDNQVRGALVCLPLNAIQGLIGVLCLYKCSKYDFSPLDFVVFEALANIIGSAITNADQYHDLAISLAQVQAVQAITRDITGEIELPTLFNRIVHSVIDSTQAEGALLGVVDEENQVVRVLAVENILSKSPYPAIPLHKGMAGRVAIDGKILAVDDYQHWDEKLEGEEFQHLTSIMAIPLIWKGKVIGVLEVTQSEPGARFNQDDTNLLQLLAPNIAIAIHNAQLYQELVKRIEAQQRAESQMIQSAKLAALGQMAAGVAHEINNPLTTIAGFVELALMEMSEEAPQRADLQVVLSEANRAKGVVRRLLDFSHRRENVLTEMSVPQVIMGVIPLIDYYAKTSGVRLELSIPDNLPLVKMSAEEMKEVVLNLAQNAIDAMPHGGTLGVKTGCRVIEGKTWVEIVVIDDGEGIDENDLGRIFEPFFTRRPVGKGTGLGLAVCYGLVTNHGGRIDVQSKVGVGSQFTVLLPASAV